MRIETVTTEYKIYKYNELSDKAKKNVKEWYLESFHDADFFTEDCENDLYNLFEKTVSMSSMTWDIARVMDSISMVKSMRKTFSSVWKIIMAALSLNSLKTY